MRVIPEETLNTALLMREQGESWNAIGRALGYDRDVLRWRLDPEFVERRKANHGGPLSMLRAAAFRPCEAEIRRIQDGVPRDTRSFTGRSMGDPLPGRSALDKQRAAQTDSASFSPVRAERTYYLRGFLGP